MTDTVREQILAIRDTGLTNICLMCRQYSGWPTTEATTSWSATLGNTAASTRTSS